MPADRARRHNPASPRHPAPAPASRQAGVFTAAQAIEGGLDARQVRYRLAAGHWHRVAGRGLSAHDPGPGGWLPLQRAWAAHLTWPDSVVGYRVAAALYKMPVPPDQADDVHVLVTRRRAPLRGVVPHMVPFRSVDVARWPGGLRVTSRARTAVDCLATLEDDDAWSLFAWLSSRSVLTREQLTDHLGRRTGRDGTARVRRLHALTATGAASPAELRLHQGLRAAGVTGWSANTRVCDGEGLIGVIDVLFERERVAIEIDGFAAHSDRDTFISDRRRQNRLTAAGYVVLRFTWRDLVEDLDGVIRRIRAVVNSRAQLGPSD